MYGQSGRVKKINLNYSIPNHKLVSKNSKVLMKKIIILLFISISCSFAQTENVKSLLDLKNDIKSVEPAQNDIPDINTISEGKKSGFMAVIYSLLLPGMGELYAGNYERGKYFTIAEGVFWCTYAGFKIYGNWQKDNYKSFAVTNAEVNEEGKSSKYFADISDYMNVEEWNNERSLERNFDEMYNPATDGWQWNNRTEMIRYRSMWESSEHAFNNVRFAVGALILNRIISAIDAALSVRSHNKSLAQQTSWNVSFGSNINQPEHLQVNFQLGF